MKWAARRGSERASGWGAGCASRLNRGGPKWWGSRRGWPLVVETVCLMGVTRGGQWAEKLEVGQTYESAASLNWLVLRLLSNI